MADKNLVWQKFIAYLEQLNPKVYVPKSMRTLIAEALKADPHNEKLQAISEVITIVARPEKENSSSKFTF